MPAFHGTSAAFDDFKLPSARGSGRMSGGRHIYVSPTPDVANSFARYEGANVRPVVVDPGKTFDPSNQNHLDEIKPFIEQHIKNSGALYGPEAAMGFLRGGDYGLLEHPDTGRWMKKKGYDSIKMQEREGKETYAIFDPKRVKSIFDFARPERAKGGPVLFQAPEPLHVGPIHSAVAGRTDHLPMHVPSGSYVLPADIVSAHGEGSTIAGFKVLRRMFGGTPYGGSTKGPYGQGSGPYGEHLAKGGKTDDNSKGVAIVAAGGEYVLSPDEVRFAGDGDLDRGHKTLDEYVLRTRKELVNTLRKLPGPAQS